MEGGSTYDEYHTYDIDWTPDSITWHVDGQPIRTKYKKDTWNEDVRVFDNTSYHEDMTFGGRLLIDLLHDSGVEKHIPPFRIIVNPDDRPLIQKDWVLWDMAVQSARVGSGKPNMFPFLHSGSPTL